MIAIALDAPMRLIILIAALVPAILWLHYFRERDRFETDAEDVWTAVLVGAVVALPVLGFVGFWTSWSGVTEAQASPLVRAIVHAALPEEGLRLFAVVALFWRRTDPARPREIIVLTASVAAGFAAIENVLYAIDEGHWGRIVALRSVTSVPSHIFCGVVMGACLAAARLGRPAFLPLSYFAPVLFHGLYDYFLFIDARIAFTLTILVEGTAAHLSFAALSRYAAASAVPQRAFPAWHWMRFGAVRVSAWAVAALLALAGGIAGIVMVIPGVVDRAWNADMRRTVLATGLLLLFHGAAFGIQAREARRFNSPRG